MKKAFTLVEISIVVIISAILFVLLSKVYILASKLYVYQTNVKNIETDLFFFNQTLQNLADSSQVNFSKYINLKNTYGITGSLYLKQWNTSYKIFATWWQILMYKNVDWKLLKIPLTNTWATFVKTLKFKIIPYVDPFKIYLPTNTQPLVKVYLDIQNRFYNKWNWAQDVKFTLQESFNFRYYDF